MQNCIKINILWCACIRWDGWKYCSVYVYVRPILEEYLYVK